MNTHKVHGNLSNKRQRSVNNTDKTQKTEILAQNRYSRSSHKEEIKTASSPCKGVTSLKSFKVNRPAYATRRKTAEACKTTDNLSTFLAILRVH